MPRLFRFSDVDEFRLVHGSSLEFTPLSSEVSGKQAVLSLPGFTITLLETFPRLVDMQLAAHCTMVGFPIDDGLPMRLNGVEEEGIQVMIGGAGAVYSGIERSSRKLVSIVFTPEVRDREWPASDRLFNVFQTTAAARNRLQQVALLTLGTEVGAGDSFERGTVARAIKESLLAAVDPIFFEGAPARTGFRADPVSQYRIFQRAEALISRDLGEPIYSAELARQLGVSVRTLQGVVQRYRGMPLHQYLRIRRLWLVRRRLLAGAVSVKATALAMGFWHLGDFSRSYRTMFGETPSETLSRSR